MTSKGMISIIKHARADEREKTVAYTVNAYSTAMSMILYDRFNFTEEQLQKIAMEINDIFDSIAKGYLSIEDIQKAMYDEGIDISFKK